MANRVWPTANGPRSDALRRPDADPSTEIFHGCGSEIADFVEEAVIERVASVAHSALEQPQINHHAGDGIGAAPNGHLSTIAMAMNATT